MLKHQVVQPKDVWFIVGHLYLNEAVLKKKKYRALSM